MILASALLVLFIAAPASHETRARELYRQGRTHYDLGEYGQAIAAFKESYHLSEAPELLYDIAQAYRLQGHSECNNALRFYRSYLRSDPKTPKRRATQDAMADMERCATEHPQKPLPAEPQPPHVIPERPPSSGVDTPQPDVVVTTPVARTEVRPIHRSWIGPVAIAGGSAALVGGGLFLWARLRYDSLQSSGGCSPACAPSSYSAPRIAQPAGVALMVAGAAAASTAAAVWLFARKEETVPVASVVPLRDGAAVVVSF